MYCETCGVENLETTTRCIRCGRDFLNRDGSVGALPAPPRKWLRPRNILLFLFIWAVLVFEIVLTSGRVPETPLGCLGLVILGPIGYVLLAAFLDSVFATPRR